MRVIGVSGMPGSGKSIISDKCVEKGAIIVSMGDIIREEAKKRGETTGETAVNLRKEPNTESSIVGKVVEGILYLCNTVSIKTSDFERRYLPKIVLCINCSGYFVLESYGLSDHSASSSERGLKCGRSKSLYSGFFNKRL